MKFQNHFKKILTIFVLFSLTATISGCAPKDRYKNVDALIAAIEPSTTGEILYEEKDKGGGVTAPSTIEYHIEGAGTFEILVERIQAVEGIVCANQNAFKIRRLECRKGVVAIKAIENPDDATPYTFLYIEDALNGTES